MTYPERTARIKIMIVQCLNLVMDPDDIADEAPLYEGGARGGLALDAVDARMLVRGMHAEFGVAPRHEDRSVFESVSKMSCFIQERLTVAARDEDTPLFESASRMSCFMQDQLTPA